MAAASAWVWAEKEGKVAARGEVGRGRSSKVDDLIKNPRKHFGLLFGVGEHYVEQARALGTRARQAAGRSVVVAARERRADRPFARYRITTSEQLPQQRLDAPVVFRRTLARALISTPCARPIAQQARPQEACCLAPAHVGTEAAPRLDQQFIAARERVERCGQPVAAKINMAERRGHSAKPATPKFRRKAASASTSMASAVLFSQQDSQQALMATPPFTPVLIGVADKNAAGRFVLENDSAQEKQIGLAPRASEMSQFEIAILLGC
jgi:hypothetical protein